MPASVAVQRLNAQLSRARIAKWDFEEATSYLLALRGRRLTVIRRALLTSAIVAYSRPFTQNETDSNSNATPQLSVNIKAILSAKQLELHELLITLRHKALAHSSYAFKPVGRVKGSKRGFLLSGRPFDVLSQPLDHKELITMCAKLEAHCENKMFSLNRQIARHESAALNPAPRHPLP